jgi:hypothetical protein
LSGSAGGKSKREQSDNPSLAAINIRGSISDRDGVASLANIRIEAPGIQGQMEGTFALRDKSINLNGVLQTTGKLSDTTPGMKSLMLKALGPLWPRRASVQLIPFRISGTASHPTFKLKLHP